MRLIALFFVLLSVPFLAVAQTAVPAQPVAPAQADNDSSFLHYSADYEVHADATSVETDNYDILLKTKAGVDNFSQVRLSYSDKMETMDVLEAYTVTADGQRQDVPADKIYVQESYSSASAAAYADQKVKVVVFPNLAPGARIVYRCRLTRHTPYFPGYFGLWETFSVFSQYQDATVTLTAPRSLQMQVFARGVEGGQQQRLRDGQARWQWHYHREQPMKLQNWMADVREFSPTIMASSFADWSQMGLAYDRAAEKAAAVTPHVRALADQITAGIEDRRDQAAALYAWVARNIRYVAVYLGNGGLEPNSADSILANQYGDCKDHTVILGALLAAKGIASTPVLIGAGVSSLQLPPVAVLGRFNHAINYLPEFDLYLDSTSPYARFGQLPGGDLSQPVVHAVDGKVTRTPDNDSKVNHFAARGEYVFDRDGGVRGDTTLNVSASDEIAMRGLFARMNAQNRGRAEESVLAQAGFDGHGELILHGDPQDLSAPFDFGYRFQARDYVDFSVPGGMTLPNIAGLSNEAFRTRYTTASAETNLTPFLCPDTLREETYALTFPEGVPIVAIPRDVDFHDAAGEYSARWSRQGNTVTAVHSLRLRAVHGPDALCQPEDYPAFRELYQQVRRGFRGQIIYGDLNMIEQK